METIEEILGGRLPERVGHDTKITFNQRDSLWIVKMIVDGPKLVKSGDSTTVALFNQFDKIDHPRYERFSDNDLSDLMSYLKAVGRAWEK